MPTNKPIKSPAGYTPTFAIGYSADNGELAIVEAAMPLPVTVSSQSPLSVQQFAESPPAPLEGTATASMIAGPYLPAAGRAVVLTLSGEWDGELRVERSSNAGASRHGLTAGGSPWAVYATNVCEPIWEEQETGAELYLDITINSGTIAYRIAQ